MRRGLAWLGGALGLAALWRFLRQEQQAQRHPVEPPPTDAPDPAAELRARLEQAREAPDDRDEFDAAEGQPVDQAEPREPVVAEQPVEEPPAPEKPDVPEEPVETRSLEERRREIHEKAQQALGEMQHPPE